MKFIHLGDLHIGKRLHERSMIDEQRNAFAQILDAALAEKVDAILIAGDVFDKAIPSKEALEAAEELLAGFIKNRIPVYMIPGNHDSAQQVSYCSTITAAAGLHVAKYYAGAIDTYRVEDEFGPIEIHLLPFVKPTDVRMGLREAADTNAVGTKAAQSMGSQALAQAAQSMGSQALAQAAQLTIEQAEELADAIRTHDDAVRIALEQHMADHPLDPGARHILVAHQFVCDGDAAPETSDSETKTVGGIDSVQASNFDAFDYVALGHLHGRQSVRRPEVRYCGSPVKYSFSEANQTKTISVVEIGAKDSAGSNGVGSAGSGSAVEAAIGSAENAGSGSAENAGRAAITIKEIPIKPLHEMREIKASFAELEARIDLGDHEDYMHVTLTDRSLFNASDQVRAIYPNMLHLTWDDEVNESAASTLSLEGLRAKSIEELFGDFIREQSGEDLRDGELEMFRETCGDSAGVVAAGAVAAGASARTTSEGEE